MSNLDCDVLVIGGGFYGVVVANYLVTERNLSRVVLIEQESDLMQHASYTNQARIHNGYHYPRSFITAYRSRINFPKFVKSWPEAVISDFVKLYAISRKNSKVTPRQFERFCDQVGAQIAVATNEHQTLFSNNLIAAVYEVQEYAFDATSLAQWGERVLNQSGVIVRKSTRVLDVCTNELGGLITHITSAAGNENVRSRLVFNCSYSGLAQLGVGSATLAKKLKHEIAEITLIEPPPALKHVGVTVMDGAFFSTMPFPARGLHSLTHVRYTPHMQWTDAAGKNPYDILAQYDKQSRFDRMLRDSQRYLPCLAQAGYRDSIFEVKTILQKNETDDGRPILLDRSEILPGMYSILGGKIDNIYDVLEKLDHENLARQ